MLPPNQIPDVETTVVIIVIVIVTILLLIIKIHMKYRINHNLHFFKREVKHHPSKEV